MQYLQGVDAAIGAEEVGFGPPSPIKEPEMEAEGPPSSSSSTVPHMEHFSMNILNRQGPRE